MPPGCDNGFVRVSKTLTVEEIGKRKKKVFTIVFVFITVLIILNLLKFSSSASSHKIKRIKRHTTGTKSDIEILSSSRKIYHHPNHRYEEEPDKKAIKSRKGWPAQSSHWKRDKHPSNIQDVILKGMGGKGKFLKGSGSTMRLRGVYVHPESENGLNELGRTYYDSTEINNLMRNDSSGAGKRPVNRRFKSPGAPFKLPVKGRGDPRRQTPNKRSKTRPITIYLDFYPENHSDEYRRTKPAWDVLPISRNKLRSRLPTESTINTGKFLPPHESGIIMKLNLYPKESGMSERNSDRQTSRSEHNKRAERKSFGWFSKNEKMKTHPKECSIAGLNPLRNRITAKWKNEKGEWIHAEHVDIKYLKKEND